MSKVIKFPEQNSSKQLWVLYQNAWKAFQHRPTEANEEAASNLAGQWKEAFKKELPERAAHA